MRMCDQRKFMDWSGGGHTKPIFYHVGIPKEACLSCPSLRKESDRSHWGCVEPEIAVAGQAVWRDTAVLG